MRRVALAVVVAVSGGACRSYDSYTPLADQAGLIPAQQFARYGRQQAEIVAIGRALSEWRMTGDQAGLTEQTDRAGCFARRFPDVATVDADPPGRVGIVPIPGSTAPDAIPGINPPGPSPCT
jgi:hypothetical protein